MGTSANSFRGQPPVPDEALALLAAMEEQFGPRRADILQQAAGRRERLIAEGPGLLAEAADPTEWHADPAPAELMERRVELIGGCGRKALVDGMNAGAKSYVADLWNMTCNEPEAIWRAHKNIARATDLHLMYIGDGGERIRLNPRSSTRLTLAPRPLQVHDRSGLPGTSAPAAFVDLAVHAVNNAAKLVRRQGVVSLFLRGVRGCHEARLWADLFIFLEKRLGLARGSFRATVMLDSLAAVIDADGILRELKHHSAGLSLDPQGYAADLVALFSTLDGPLMPDREHIGMDAPFLRGVSLRAISICHRRQVHAMGAPAFVLPPDGHGTLNARYLEMLGDKEREAVDGHDGTLVAHAGLVNPAMTEFNKSMPRAHQMYYQREDKSTWAELTAKPEGELTTEGMQRCIRTVLKGMVLFREQGMVVQGGRLHDRSSIRLATVLLWHWAHGKGSFSTGLEIHEGVVKYLIRKEGDKLFAMEGAELHDRAVQAAQRLTQVVLAPHVPADLLEMGPQLVDNR